MICLHVWISKIRDNSGTLGSCHLNSKEFPFCQYPSFFPPCLPGQKLRKFS